MSECLFFSWSKRRRREREGCCDRHINNEGNSVDFHRLALSGDCSSVEMWDFVAWVFRRPMGRRGGQGESDETESSGSRSQSAGNGRWIGAIAFDSMHG